MDHPSDQDILNHSLRQSETNQKEQQSHNEDTHNINKESKYNQQNSQSDSDDSQYNRLEQISDEDDMNIINENTHKEKEKTLIIIEDKSKENTFFSLGVHQQVKVALGSFNKADTDNDGSIAVHDFVMLLKQYDQNYDHRHVKSILEKYSMNNQNMFTFQDLLTVINDLSIYQKSLDYQTKEQGNHKLIGVNLRIIEFLKLLNQYKQQCISVQRNYMEANKIQEKMNKIRVIEIERWKINIRCIHKTELEDQERVQENLMEKLNNKWDEQIKDIDIKSLKYLQSVQQKNDTKVQEFYGKVEKQVHLKIKPDKNISVLRRQERQYANMQDYIGAGQIKKNVDKLEAQDNSLKNTLRENLKKKQVDAFVLKQQSNYDGQLQRIIKLRQQLVQGKEKETHSFNQSYLTQQDYTLKQQKKEESRMQTMIQYVFNYYDKTFDQSATMKNFKRGRKLVSINNTRQTNDSFSEQQQIYNQLTNNNPNPNNQKTFNKSIVINSSPNHKIVTEPHIEKTSERNQEYNNKQHHQLKSIYIFDPTKGNSRALVKEKNIKKVMSTTCNYNIRTVDVHSRSQSRNTSQRADSLDKKKLVRVNNQ